METSPTCTSTCILEEGEELESLVRAIVNEVSVSPQPAYFNITVALGQIWQKIILKLTPKISGPFW
jgi:hypothetical protein